MKTFYKRLIGLGLMSFFVMGVTLGCEEEYEPMTPGDNPPPEPTIDPVTPEPQDSAQPGSTPGQENYEVPSTTPEN